MTKTEKRIELLKLLVKLKQHGEAPGETILRALRELDRHAHAPSAGEEKR